MHTALDLYPGDSEDLRQENDLHSEKEVQSKLPTPIGQEVLDERTEDSDQGTQEKVLAILPDLLRAFALKVGHDAPTQMHRDVMFLICKNYNGITSFFKGKIFQQGQTVPEVPAATLDIMSLADRVNLLFKLQGAGKVRLEEEAENGQQTATPWTVTYQDFLINVEAYKWLFSRLHRELRLATGEPNIIATIGRKITSPLLAPHNDSGMISSNIHEVIFKVDWDPIAFCQEQEYPFAPSEAVDRVITCTGSFDDAQALTSAEYLRQAWPSTGEAVMKLIKDMLSNGSGNTRDLFDATKISGYIDGPVCIIKAIGVTATLVEIGEQLAWLGAALRTSGIEQGAVECTPFIKVDHQINTTSPEMSSLSLDVTIYRIGFTTEKVRPTAIPSSSQRWHNMFRSPVIVKGYPIPRRREPQTGIEMPLSMMTALVGASKVVPFKGKLFIKGFSMMLVLNRRSKDILFWHLIYNQDGGPVSYLDDIPTHAENITFADLENLRHVVG
ncbi:hypothetical protein F5X99DRAFT_422978 [Biscogniauxia marginata]|nr:hypothetical protein F5X99DRAFT_422978 [Biscogniauxia marginata]